MHFVCRQTQLSSQSTDQGHNGNELNLISDETRWWSVKVSAWQTSCLREGDVGGGLHRLMALVAVVLLVL